MEVELKVRNPKSDFMISTYWSWRLLFLILCCVFVRFKTCNFPTVFCRDRTLKGVLITTPVYHLIQGSAMDKPGWHFCISLVQFVNMEQNSEPYLREITLHMRWSIYFLPSLFISDVMLWYGLDLLTPPEQGRRITVQCTPGNVAVQDVSVSMWASQ